MNFIKEISDGRSRLMKIAGLIGLGVIWRGIVGMEMPALEIRQDIYRALLRVTPD